MAKYRLSHDKILEMIESRKLSAEEGFQLLKQLGENPEQPEENSETPSTGCKAFVLDQPGEVENIKTVPVETKDPKSNQVQIRVRAFSLNFADLLCVMGLYPNMPEYPFIPGLEVSGVVEKVGSDVSRFQPGDKVIALMGPKFGGQSQLVITNEIAVVKKPENLTFEEACSLPIVFLTMYQVFEQANLKPNEKILIQTAAGGTGLIGVQLAKLFQAEIFVTAGSQQKLDHLANMGVQHRINYREEDFSKRIMEITNGNGVDVVINTLSGDAIQKGLDCLAPGGRYCEIAMAGLKESKPLDLSGLVDNQSFFSFDLGKFAQRNPEKMVASMEVMIRYLKEGKIKPSICKVFPFAQLSDAYTFLQNRENIGKVIVQIPDEGKQIVPEKESKTEREAVEENSEIAIIGIAGRFPGADSVEEFWENLAAGKNSIGPVPKDRWDHDLYYDPSRQKKNTSYSNYGGFVRDVDLFDPQFFKISGREAELADPQQRLLLEECWKALEDAGYANSLISDKRCGVFIGAAKGDYTETKPEEVKLQTYSWLGNTTSVTSARISFFLNLKGPAITLDTACSSSLVAIHLARQSLVTEECSVALAGGVLISSTPYFHILTSNSNMLSPEGKCKTFDDDADGFAPGEGVGVIVMKPLRQAQKDRDHIYGVLKASGLNQDGKTNGITAPSSLSQTELEVSVYERFGIHPETINYVEAHGTGTRLGDPIEVEALTKAFRKFTDRTGFCAIGSVKTNVGHTATAAGMASMIKMLLALKHEKLPASLHFQKENEQICFAETPFFVNTELLDWKKGENPRRAALSSFGFSGTNAHMILEEAPEREQSSEPKKPFYLIPISAESQTALNRRYDDLLRWLNGKEGKEAALGDLAYTLLVRRAHCSLRSILIVKDREELMEQLSNHIDNGYGTIPVYDADEAPAFDEEDEEEANRWILDFDQQNNLSGIEYEEKVRTMAGFYTGHAEVEWHNCYRNSTNLHLSLPVYPFDRERYWIEEVQPALPSTIVKSAALHPVIDYRDYSSDEVCFVKEYSGGEFYIADHGQMLPGVVYMEMVRAAGNELSETKQVSKIKKITWSTPLFVHQEPKNAYVTFSNNNHSYAIHSLNEEGTPMVHSRGEVEFVENRAMTRQESLDVQAILGRCQGGRDAAEEYFAGSVKRGGQLGPRFMGIQKFYWNQEEALSEIDILPEQKADSKTYGLHPTLTDAAFQTMAAFGFKTGFDLNSIYLPFMLETLEIVDLNKEAAFVYVRFAENSKKMDAWVLDADGAVQAKMERFSLRPFHQKKEFTPSELPLCFETTWKESEISNAIPEENSNDAILVIDRAGKGTQPPNSKKEAEALIATFQQQNELNRVLYFWNEEADGIEPLFYLLQSLSDKKQAGTVDFCLVTNSVQGLSPLFFAAWNGFEKSLAQESRKLRFKTVTVQGSDATTLPLSWYLEMTRREFREDRIAEKEVRIINGKRQVRSLILTSANDETTTDQQQTGSIKANGVYLITGGMGKIGRIFAEFLMKKYQAQVALVGRSPMSDEIETALNTLSQVGGKVAYFQADIAKADSVRDLLNAVKTTFGGLNGIIHSSGVLRDSFFVNKKIEDIRQVLAPKIEGALLLDEMTQSEPLDFFTLFSSTTAHFGYPGQTDYGYANRFLDEFAIWREERRKEGKRTGKTVSFSWPLWKEGGMKLDENAEKMLLQTAGIRPLENAPALELFEQTLRQNTAHRIVVSGDHERIQQAMVTPEESTKTEEATATGGDAQSNRELFLQDIVAEIADLLKIPQQKVKLQRQISEYGFDSMSFTELSHKINLIYQLGVTPDFFFDHTTLSAIAEALYQEFQQTLDAFYNSKKTTTEPVKQVAPISEKETYKEESVTEQASKAPETRVEETKVVQEPVVTSPVEKESDTPEPIAVIGLDGVFPQSENLEQFWDNLRESKNLITEIPEDRWDWRIYDTDNEEDPNHCKVKWGGFMTAVDRFDPLFFSISPIEAEVMDPQLRIFLQTAWATIEDAGYRASDLAGSKTGVFIGSTNNDYYRLLSRADDKVLQFGFMISNRVSYFLDFQGPSESIDTACSSSLVAVHHACQSLRNDSCDMALVGGVNVIVDSGLHIAVSKTGSLSNDGRCFTFDERANGYVRGEGVGSVLLKRLSQAEKEGDHIYGLIRSTGVNHSGHTNSPATPSPVAQANLIVETVERAKVDPSTIGFVEVHGTGTSLGDPIEINGLKNAFAQLYEKWNLPMPTKPHCGLGTVKTSIGHLEPAAGISGLLKLILSMNHELIPGNPNFQKQNPYIKLENSPLFIVDQAQPWQRLSGKDGEPLPRRSGLSSFGIGGTNAHLLFEEYMKPKQVAEDRSMTPELFLLSAKANDRLQEYAKKYLRFIDRNRIACPEEEKANKERLKEALLNIVSTILNVSTNEIDLWEQLEAYGFDHIKINELREKIKTDEKIEGDCEDLSTIFSIEELAERLRFRSDCETSRNDRFSLDLRNLAHTLRTGREAMRERLAMVVCDIAELENGLRAFVEGTRLPSGLFLGNAKELEQLAEDEESLNLQVETALKQADMAQLAQLWSKGAAIDWSLLTQAGGKKVSAPTYPFRQDRCWSESITTDRAISTSPTQKVEPASKVTAVEPAQKMEPATTITATVPGQKIEPATDQNKIESAADQTGTAETVLKQLFSSMLKLDVDRIDLDAGYEELGMDSIMIEQLNQALSDILGVTVPSTLFFSYKTVGALAQHLGNRYKDNLKTLDPASLSVKADSLRHPLLRKHQESNEESPVETQLENQVESQVTDTTTEEYAFDTDDEIYEEDMKIAIIGMSGKYPMAKNLDEFWENLKEGKNAVTEIPQERWDYREFETPTHGQQRGMYCRWGGFIDGVDQFDPLFFSISPLEARFMDPHERLFLQDSWACLEDAGYTERDLEDPNAGDRRASVGVFAGVTFNNYQLFASSEFAKGNMMAVSSQLFSVANRVSYFLNLRGPSLSVDTACSSSLYAVHLACDSIKRRECEMAIAGGVNLSIHPSKYMALCEANAGSGQGFCNAFGEGGDGYVPAEAVGTVLLKPLEKAIEDGDQIHATILSTTINHDGKTYGYTVPNPVAQTELIQTAMERAKIDPRTISYVEAHGTGTSLGDPIEIQGLTDAFQSFTNDTGFCAIGSVKSNIGHAEAAAGISQIAKVVLQMKHKTLVPTLIHTDNLNPNIDFQNSPFEVQRTLKEWTSLYPRRAGISSFGVGGVNAHIILEEAPEQRRTAVAEVGGNQKVILPISAKTPESLLEMVESLAGFFKKSESNTIQASLSEIAWNLQTGRESMPCRLALVTNSIGDGIQKLENLINGGLVSSPEVGIFYHELSGKTQAGKGESVIGEEPETVAQKWINGSEIDWNSFHGDASWRKISLPTYCFAKDSFWLVENSNQFFTKNEQAEAPVETAAVTSTTQAPAATQAVAGTETVTTVPSSNENRPVLNELRDAPESEQLAILKDYLKEAVGELLEFPPGKLPTTKQGFFDLGVDSVLSTKLYLVIEKALGLQLYATATFDYSNIELLAGYILENLDFSETEEDGMTAQPVADVYDPIYFQNEWEPQSLNAAQPVRQDGVLWIFDPEEALFQKAIETGAKAILIQPGSTVKKVNDQRYQFNPQSPADYQALIQLMEQEGALPKYIVHSLSSCVTGDSPIEQQVDYGIMSCFHLIQGLVRKVSGKDLHILMTYAGSRTEIQPQFESLSGFAKSLAQETSHFVFRTMAHQAEKNSCPDQILTELYQTDQQDAVLYEQGNRWVKTIREAVPPESINQFQQQQLTQTPLRENGVYLITGGTGGLGLHFAKYITSKVKAKLVLCGSSTLNQGKRESIAELEQLGAEVLYVQADMTSEEAVNSLVKQTKERFGELNGIIHSAGIIRDAYLLKKDADDFAAVIGPKVQGLVYLDEVTKGENLDFFVLFSSIVAAFGNPGQCDYALANNFLDRYAERREQLRKEGKRQGKTVSINWQLWQDGGMHVDESILTMMVDTFGMAALPIEEGLKAFETALLWDRPNVGFLLANRTKLNKYLPLAPPLANGNDRIEDTGIERNVAFQPKEEPRQAEPENLTNNYKENTEETVEEKIESMTQGDVENELESILSVLNL